MLGGESFFSKEVAPCVAENRVRSRSLRTICRSFNKSLTARSGLGIKSGVPASSWESPTEDGLRPWPSRRSATNRPSVAPAAATNAWGYPASWSRPRGRDARSRFPPLQRAQIVELACLEPVAEGLHITHWTSEDLARQAVADGIVPSISARTVRRILHDVDFATPPDSLLEDSSTGCPVQAAGREGPLVLRQRPAPGQAGLLGGLRR